MEIRGDLSYWIRRVELAARANRAKDLVGKQPEWLILSARNWAEIKHLMVVNEVLRYYSMPEPDQPSVFCGFKVAIADLWKSEIDFLEVA